MTEKPRKDAMLSYAPGEPRTRKILLRLFWVMLVVAIGVGSVWKILPELEHRRRILSLQRTLALAGDTPTNVVFHAETQRGSDGVTSMSGSGGSIDSNWSRFRDLSGSPAVRERATLYGHRIKDRHGNDLLIEIRFTPTGLDDVPGFITDVIKPGSLWRYPSVAPIVVRPFDFGLTLNELCDGNLKIYAGQPDAADPSHFSIEYELKGQRHMLDGYIDDQDVLRIERRKEPTTFGSDDPRYKGSH